MHECKSDKDAIIDILKRLEVIEKSLKIYSSDEHKNSSIRKHFKI